DLGDEVGDRQRDRQRAQPARLVRRREAELAAEVARDQRALREHDVARAQERRREHEAELLAQLLHLRDAALAAADVDVVGTRILEHETRKLAAALDPRPVVELVAHGAEPTENNAATPEWRRRSTRSERVSRVPTRSSRR